MSVQITVRLPEDLVAFVDALVADGICASRADAVAQALTRDRRRRTALADVEILRRGLPPDSEGGVATGDSLDGLARFAVAHAPRLDD